MSLFRDDCQALRYSARLHLMNIGTNSTTASSNQYLVRIDRLVIPGLITHEGSG